jgi:hypothetical protein
MLRAKNFARSPASRQVRAGDILTFLRVLVYGNSP